MHVCMKLMAVRMELVTVESPWNFEYGDFITSSIGALESNGTASGTAW
jgi:hypothetical protein